MSRGMMMFSSRQSLGKEWMEDKVVMIVARERLSRY
jgi:hypothetical protein